MKQNYSQRLLSKLTGKFLLSGVLAIGAFINTASAQQSYTFTSCGATGQFGPSQAQVNTAYASTNLNGLVSVTGGGIQTFTIPFTGNYRLEADGAQGGNSPANPGGLGARMIGEFAFNAGDVLKILVGQSGIDGIPLYNTDAEQAGGTGGGGSFVSTSGNVALIVGGGGGGASQMGAGQGFNANGIGGTTTEPGVSGGNSANSGGIGGNGGVTYNWSGWHGGTGGGGFTGNGVNNSVGVATYGTPNTPGLSFVNGGAGGTGGSMGRNGGFGGGGASGFTGAGGGGYSGGGAGATGGVALGGGGGGSYNNGINQSNTAAVNSGNGQVILTTLCFLSLASTSSSVCLGNNTVTLTTNAIGNYSWSTGNTTSSVIVVSPTVTTTYTVSGTSPLNCPSTAVITVTVNSAVPALTVSASSPSTCLGNTISVGATGALTYTWSNGITNNIAFVPSAGVNVYTVTGTNGCGTSSTVATVTVSSLPVTAVASSTLLCAGMVATLTAGNATTYTWMPGISTLTNYVVYPAANTTYTLSGRTGSCTGQTTIVLTTKANPTLNIAPSNTTICSGNVVNLLVSGNATAYVWNTGQTGVSISSTPTTLTLYTATGTASNNCVSTTQQIIYVNPNPTVSASASNQEVCINGPSVLSAFGANSYTWNTGATGASVTVNTPVNTTYSVTGSYSTGCISISTVAVSVFVPAIAAGADAVICMGKNVTISAGGADSYTWTNNNATGPSISVSPSANTVYTVTGSVSDPLSGVSCDASNTLQVTVNANPTITISSDRIGNIICLGEPAVLTASGSGTGGTYVWPGTVGANAINTVTPIADQTYTVNGTDANGCKGSASILIKVVVCSGIPAIAINATDLSIYPNPNNGEFTIASDREITLQITNELGQQVRVITLNAAAHEVKVDDLANGFYLITGSDSKGIVKKKIVVAK